MAGFILYIILVHCLGWTEVDEREEKFALKKGVYIFHVGSF